MSEPIFMFDGQDPAMSQANEEARKTFKHFWRELSWERRRIIPALDLAAVKLPFTDGPRSDGFPEHEFMWIEDVEYDGTLLRGDLLNSPNWLTSVKAGDSVEAPLAHLADWMISREGLVYGAYTVQCMRSGMKPKERYKHDQAWGLDFGDPKAIHVIVGSRQPYTRGFFGKLLGKKAAPSSEPESLIPFRDHAMCINCAESIQDQIKEYPTHLTRLDDDGWTLLHTEAMAGNLAVVQVLLQCGADPHVKTPAGLDAAALAEKIGWKEIADYIRNPDSHAISSN